MRGLDHAEPLRGLQLVGADERAHFNRMKLDFLIEMPTMVTGLWRQFGVHLFEGRMSLPEIVKMDEAAIAHDAQEIGLEGGHFFFLEIAWRSAKRDVKGRV